MALTQISVAFVELVVGTGVADVEAISEIEKKIHHGRYLSKL